MQLHEGLASLYDQILAASVVRSTSPSFTHQFYLPLGTERVPEASRRGVSKIDLFPSIYAHAVLLSKSPTPAQIERVRILRCRYSSECS